MSMRPSTSQTGFTLIELSIVLVIIGLIVGGILVGKDLIHQAEIRAFISQINQYNAAVNTFRVKYNGIPGDIKAEDAVTFGMLSRRGGSGHGDGDGLLKGGGDGGHSDLSSAIAGEIALFWRDLSFAQLIAGNYMGIDCDSWGPDCPVLSNSGAVQTVLPAAKLGSGNSIFAYSDPADGKNYYQIVDLVSLGTLGSGLCGAPYSVNSNAMTPRDAYNIDMKLDDGLPNTGTITARSCGLSQNPWAYTPGLIAGNGGDAKDCAYAATNSYNTNVPEGLGCSIRLPFN